LFYYGIFKITVPCTQPVSCEVSKTEDEDPILLARIILDISTPEDKDTMLPDHVRIQLPSDSVPLPYPGRMGSSIANTHYI